MSTKKFSHGTIAMMDSFFRKALLGQNEQFPLSSALHTSCKLKRVLPRAVYNSCIGSKKQSPDNMHRMGNYHPMITSKSS
jgi:hypothetical protein